MTGGPDHHPFGLLPRILDPKPARRPLRARVAAAAALGLLVAACTSGSPVTVPPSTPGATATSPPGTPTPTPTSTGPLRVALQPVVKLSSPLAMAVRTGDPALYVAGQGGTIHAIRGGRVDPTPILDIGSKISLGSERGLLGLAFSADGSLLYVDYTDTGGDTNVVEYRIGSDGRAVTSSARRVLFQKQPFSNHNGGNLVLGPDGDLYIGLGDGGRGGDPFGNGQDLGTQLGKILRIDPRPSDGMPYTVPAGNPFAGDGGALPQIWDYGLRNPWRFSFDALTGDLWIGDVGQNAWEEIDHEPAGRGGRNYGWNRMEGNHPYQGDRPSNAVGPVHEYPHEGGACSVTGGYVYRGTAIPGPGGRLPVRGLLRRPGHGPPGRQGDRPRSARDVAELLRAGPAGRALRDLTRRADLEDRAGRLSVPANAGGRGGRARCRRPPPPQPRRR